MKLTTEDIMGCACHRGDWTLRSSFNEWLESHDTEVRAETLEDVMHDRVADLTPAELIQCAWDAAYPVPEGRVIPVDVGVLRKGGRMITYYEPGVVQGNPVHEPGEFRTLAPLPPLIPDDCNAVWAGNEWLPDGVRVLWVRESDVFWRHIVTQVEAQKWCGNGTLAFDVLTAVSDELINPVPIPKEAQNAE